MPTIQDVLIALEAIAPERFAYDFDRIGLQVGNRQQKVERAIVSLDRSLGAVRFAKESSAQLLLAHHPLIFQPIGAVDTRNHTGKTITELIKADISFIAAHTNWDCALGGINDALVEIFGLTETKPFGLTAANSDQPAGRVGKLPEPTTLKAFANLAGEKLGLAPWVWGDAEKRIKKVAVVGGAADTEWMAAQRAGADLLLTGEVKQHVAVEAVESGFCLIAAGHYATEHPGCEALRRRMAEALPEIEWKLFTPPAGRHGRPL